MTVTAFTAGTGMFFFDKKVCFYVYVSVSQTMSRDPNMGRQGFLSGSRKASVDTVNLLA